MFYREAGQFKASYAADQAVFTLRQDQWGVADHAGDRPVRVSRQSATNTFSRPSWCRC